MCAWGTGLGFGAKWGRAMREGGSLGGQQGGRAIRVVWVCGSCRGVARGSEECGW